MQRIESDLLSPDSSALCDVLIHRASDAAAYGRGGGNDGNPFELVARFAYPYPPLTAVQALPALAPQRKDSSPHYELKA